MSDALHAVDLLIIIGYLVGILWWGISIGRRHRGPDDFFLAGRNVAWPLIGISLFASNISSTTLIGLAGEAYSTGISVFNYEWMAAVVLVFFCIVFLPQLIRSGVSTLPEFLERRYDRAARLWFTLLTLFLNIVVDTAGSLFAGALMLQLVFPALTITQIVVALTLASGLYTCAGGLSAVIHTDAAQTVLLMIGSVFIAVTALTRVGGWDGIVGSVDPAKLSLIRPVGDPGVPWTGLLTGVPLLGFYFWCTNQFMAQRFLAARDLEHARRGALLAGLLKLPVLFLMVLPGTAAILLFPGLDRPDMVYPTLLVELLPAGLLGLVLAGFLAALMSQIDSTLNSAATLVTMDLLQPRRPDWDRAQLLKAGRIATLCFMVLAALWAPRIATFPSLFKYLQAVLSYAVPPVLSLYLLGLFWPRANAAGARLCLAGGTLAGAILFLANELLLLHAGGSLASAPPDITRFEDLLWRGRGRGPDRMPVSLRWAAAGLIALTGILVLSFA